MRPSITGRLVRNLLAHRGCIAAPLAGSWQRELRVIAETRAKTDMLLTDAAALQILICVRTARRLPGAMAEAGVFKGGSARLICETKGSAPLHLFDVFETLQQGAPPEAQSVREHFGRVHGTQAAVERLLASYTGVHIHPGLFPGTARGLEHLQFSLVHLDLDLPGPTTAALEFFRPRLLPGGLLIGDDYNDPQLRRCFEDYFAGRADTVIELPWSQVMVVRQP